MCVTLVGNKADAPAAKWFASRKEMQELGDQLVNRLRAHLPKGHLMAHELVSAKSGSNLELTFLRAKSRFLSDIGCVERVAAIVLASQLSDGNMVRRKAKCC
jgi:hypothetical protein